MATVDLRNIKPYEATCSCVACGGVQADDVFVFLLEKDVDQTTGQEKIWDKSLIERTCRNCGYRWAEYPLYRCKDGSLVPVEITDSDLEEDGEGS